MPSLALRMIAAGAFMAIVIPAVAFPSADMAVPGDYQSILRVVCGGVLFGSGLGLAASLEKTLLRAGGNSAFKMLYVSAAGFSGVGAVQCLYLVYQVNTLLSVMLFSVLAIVTCIMWLRFYHAAAG